MAKPRLLTDADTLENEFLFSTPQTASLQRGQNLVTAGDKNTPFNVLNIDGRTLVNIMGRSNTINQSGTITMSGATIGTIISNTLSVNGVITNTGEGYLIYNRSGRYSFPTGKYIAIIADIKVNSISGSAPVKVGGTDGVGACSSDSTKLNIWQTVAQPFVSAGQLFDVIAGTCYAGGVFSNANFDIKNLRIYEITQAEYNALNSSSLNSVQIQSKYPYCDDVKHVQNPYLIKYGQNLLPPLQEWAIDSHAVIVDSYKLQLNADAQYLWTNSPKISVAPNQTYTYSATLNGGQITIIYFDSNDDQITYDVTIGSGLKSITKTMPSNVSYAICRLESPITGTNTFVFDSLMLNLGSTALPFEPQNNDYLFLNTTLASNLDGNVKDYVYEKDGQYFKAKRFVTDMVLDGSLPWVLGNDFTGVKQIKLPSGNFLAGVAGSGVAVKHDGKIIPQGTTSNADFNAVSSDGNFYIGVADTDSGWGEAYVPTADEIKAYFWGWKMAPNSTSASSSYTGTTGETKTWFVINGDGTYGGWTQNLPTAVALLSYKLTYQLAQEQEIAVQFEGDIQLHSGGNQIEYSEGMIIREKANPVTNSTNYSINDTVVGSASYLKNRTLKIITVYKNGTKDTTWTKGSSAYGNEMVWHPNALHDVTAEYTVSYIVLQDGSFRSSVFSGSGAYNTNFRNVVNQISQDMADLTTAESDLALRFQNYGIKGFGERIETGTVSFANPTTSGGPFTLGIVNFSRSFSSKPTVLVNFSGTFSSLNPATTLEPSGITTTGFTLYMMTNAVPTQTSTIYTWIAIGK